MSVANTVATPNEIFLRLWFPFPIRVHRTAFRRTCLVNDALEQAANRRVRQWPVIVVLRILQNFLFAIRLVQGQIRLLLQLSDFQCALGPFVQEVHQLAVDLIDAASPIAEAHVATSRRERPARAAAFSERMRSASAAAAAAMAASPESYAVAFSISETSADPTAAASASPPRTETWPGNEMPKPTAIGSCVTRRARRSRAGRSSGRASFAPVTPVREIRYRNPEEHAAIFSSRSAVEVGAPRKTVSR